MQALRDVGELILGLAYAGVGLLLYFGPMFLAFTIASDKGYDFVIASILALMSWIGLVIALLAP